MNWFSHDICKDITIFSHSRPFTELLFMRLGKYVFLIAMGLNYHHNSYDGERYLKPPRESKSGGVRLNAVPKISWLLLQLIPGNLATTTAPHSLKPHQGRPHVLLIPQHFTGVYHETICINILITCTNVAAVSNLPQLYCSGSMGDHVEGNPKWEPSEGVWLQREETYQCMGVHKEINPLTPPHSKVFFLFHSGAGLRTPPVKRGINSVSTRRGQARRISRWAVNRISQLEVMNAIAWV